MKSLLISSVFPPQIGGSGRWFWEMYRRLPREEYVIAAGDCEGAKEFDATHDLQMERLPLNFDSWGVLGWNSRNRYATARRRIAKTIDRHGIRCLHAGCALPEGLLAMQLGRKLRLPYAVYVHGEELRVFQSSRELAWLARRVYQSAAMVIANSHNTARLLKSEWPIAEERVQVLHPGVDTDYFRPAPRDEAVRRELGWDERPVVLTVGRLQKRKGHDMMIQALPKIREQVPDVLYAIVGDGEERADLERLVDELDMRSHVLFHSSIEDARILQAYQQCDLFVLPNREVNGDFEGFGIVLLEAQACGKPVIAGDSGGTAETVIPDQTGFVLDCRVTTCLSYSICRLLGDQDERRIRGKDARSHTDDRYRQEAMALSGRELFSQIELPNSSICRQT